MRFTKMHGLGNNYVFLNLLDHPEENADWSELARNVSDIHYGVGSDGLILIGPSDKADFRMRIFNADGSEGKNCGNGLRCVAKFVYDRGFAAARHFTIETLGGIVRVEVLPEEGSGQPGEGQVKVDMGLPGLLKSELPMKGDPYSFTIREPYRFEDRVFELTCVSMGNPHAILFVDDVRDFPLEYWGPRIERSDLFPDRINVGIVRVRSEREIDYRVWERGSGLTLACGTGACAAVVAATLNHQLELDQAVVVHLPGGDLTVRWDREGHVWKSGPAAYICDGELAQSLALPQLPARQA